MVDQKDRIAEIGISGMSCAGCVSAVESAILSVKGVKQASVNLPLNMASVTFDPSVTGIGPIGKAVDDIGYKVTSSVDLDGDTSSGKKMAVSMVLSLLIFLLSMNGFVFFPFILATVVQFWCGWQFISGAIKKLRHFSSDMNTLVAIGSGAAYFFSIFSMTYPQVFTSVGIMPDIYFETGAFIISFILLGKYLESRSKRRTSSAIRGLMALQPEDATVIRDGKEVAVKASDIVPGETVVIRPGERVPADGTIISGNSAVDESMITGESVPVEKSAGSKVITGTVNRTGTFNFTAEKVGKDTVLFNIIKLVVSASASKAPVQHLADRVSAVFVPFVMAVAATAFIYWMFLSPVHSFSLAFLSFISVLVISCPCALGLATPLAVVVGVGKAAKHGILIKNAGALETAGKVKAVAFDKTGTLTKGQLSVSHISNEDAILRVTASLENKSEHPVSEAVVSYAGVKGVMLADVRDFMSYPGKGIAGTVEGDKISVGTQRFMAELGIDTSALMAAAEKRAANGETVAFVSRNGKAEGFISVADEIRETSVKAVELLKKRKIKPYMLTGDNERTASAVAARAGITDHYSSLLPEEKLERVKELQRTSGPVAMVGDGINDAPSLKQADVGIAVGSGTDIAMESADIVLVKGDLLGAVKAIEVSRLTMNTIRSNLFWAFVYNLVGIPIAAGMLFPYTGLMLNPAIAALAMGMSSISVVMNSLLLNFKRINMAK